MPLSFIPFRFPGVEHVRCAFQMRSGPCAAPAAGGNISLEVGDAEDAGTDPAETRANREALVRQLRLAGFAEAHQVHGVTTLFEPKAQPPVSGSREDADGFITATPGLGLMIKTADCQPVLLAHSSGRYVAALHVGWRGNRQNYPGVGVAEFCARCKLRPEDVHAVRGPSLSPAKAEFIRFDQEWGPEFLPWFDPASRTVDLWRLTRDQLVAAGLLPEHIYSLDLCTFSLTEFFSHRRDPKSGRQASVIWMEE